MNDFISEYAKLKNKSLRHKRLMKRIFLATFLFLTMSGIAVAENNNVQGEATAQEENNSPIRIVSRPEILGLWGMEIPQNKACVEYYNFRGNNEVVIRSGQEWSSGLYDYQPPQDSKEQLPALVLQIKYDNNSLDCSGRQEDQTGEVSQYFVQWTSPRTIHFCNNEKAEQCFATLHRILP